MENTPQSFDLCIIGAGPGGYVAAIRAAQLGMKVALVEKRATLGGTCLNVGCIPSKALLESSEKYSEILHGLTVHGVQVGPPELDLSAMLARKDAVVKDVTGGLGILMKKNKIQVFQGAGRLDGPGRVKVGDQVLETERVILATGSEAVNLPFLPFDGRFVVSSTEALAFDTVPRHLVVVGAGAVGLELGSVWMRLGAKVTVVEMLPQITPFADKFVAKTLEKALKKQGMDIRLEAKVKGARVEEGDEWPVFVTVEDKKGKIEEIPCDRVLVAVGRRAYTGDVGLDTVGLAPEGNGKITVDAHFQTSVPGIWAIGDVIAGPMLAHKAEEEGIAVAEILAGKPGHVNYDAIPSVVYTWPELASVGISEEQAAEKGIAVKTGRVWLKANARARTMEEGEGLVKVIADAATDRLLGVHILGPRAGDLIAEAAVAIEFGASSEDLARCCHAHPTLAEALKEAALDVDKRAIHA